MSSPQLIPPDELLSDPSYLQLKDYLIERTGLAYFTDKDNDLARRIRRRFSSLNLRDCAAYLELLANPLRGPAEMDALIAEITIGETYLFRHPEHFDALRDLILPELIARNAQTRQLSVWCAGCADGAEPYSLAILLRRELAHLLAGWKVSILGTDINRQCLARASEGIFEGWALRSTPEALKRTCFIEKGKQWIIAPEYKGEVSFKFHNLADDPFPPQSSDISALDLIICRNVMIYFGPELIRKTVRQFHDCLIPGGWLLVGPSEPNMTCFTSFRVVNAPGVTIYQKPIHSDPDSLEAAPSKETFTSEALLEIPTLPEEMPAVDSIAVDPIAIDPIAIDSSIVDPTPVNQSGDDQAPTLVALRNYIDHADWKNAARCGKELLESDNLNAAVHFHHALVLRQMGQYAESERSFRNAIYLDRQAILAHYHLGLLLRARGDFRQAERYFQNALDLLAPKGDDEILPDADGMSVLELKKRSRMQLENLPVRA